MNVKRYILLNLGIAACSGVIGYPVVLAWHGLKWAYTKLRR
jgi:hypothetical protein